MGYREERRPLSAEDKCEHEEVRLHSASGSMALGSNNQPLVHSTAPPSHCLALSLPWADTWCPGRLSIVLSQGCGDPRVGGETGSSAET